MQVEAITELYSQASVLKCSVVYRYLYLQKWHTKERERERERESEREAQLRSKQLLAFNLRKALWKVLRQTRLLHI